MSKPYEQEKNQQTAGQRSRLHQQGLGGLNKDLFQAELEECFIDLRKTTFVGWQKLNKKRKLKAIRAYKSKVVGTYSIEHYEQMKADLMNANLTPEAYQRAVTMVARAAGI